jgi:hypothetical protein
MMHNVKDLTKDEISLLLYVETCMVDNHGRLESLRMNDTDFENLEKWNNEGFVLFGRLKYRYIAAIQKMRVLYKPTHWARLSDEAWNLVHTLRHERAERMINSKEGQKGLK